MTMTQAPVFDLADYLRKAVRESGRGMQELADELELSRETLSLWVNGKRRPNRGQLIALAHVTGVPLQWLLDAAETPPADAEGVARPKGLEPLTF